MGVKDKTRIVHYNFAAKGDEGDFIMNCDAILKKAFKDGIITNFDDGRNRDPWFEGHPGKAIRVLRDLFRNAERRKNKQWKSAPISMRMVNG